jgi:uncharacterized protein (DUF39 family)
VGDSAFKTLALSDSGFLFDTRTGRTFSLNTTGTHIVRELIAGREVETLPESVCEAFDIGEEVALRDVEQFLFRLRDMKLSEAGDNR